TLHLCYAMESVFIHGEHMVEIALGAPAQPAKFREQPLKNTDFVHLAQGRRNTLLPFEDRQKGLVHLRGGGQIGRSVGNCVAQQLACVFSYTHAVPLGVMEKSHNVEWILRKDASLRDNKRVIHNAHAVANSAAARPADEAVEARCFATAL